MDIINFELWLSKHVSKKVKSDIICRLRRIETYYSIDLDHLNNIQIDDLKKHLKKDTNFICAKSKYQINVYIYALNKYLLFRS